MKPLRRIDIELTNRCNAQCSFCPRDKMPQLGSMTIETFELIVKRIVESDENIIISFTGFGESTAHKNFLDFFRMSRKHDIPVSLTTNGHLLTPELSKELTELGLYDINFSVSDIDEGYKIVYQLDYVKTKNNILSFLEINQGKTYTKINLVEHELNIDTRDKVESFWMEAGVDFVHRTKMVNRGGAIERKEFEGMFKRHDEAKIIIKERNIKGLCSLPLASIFVDWKGEYYLCCQDWEKRMPMGNVKSYSIKEMDLLKMRKVFEGNPVCNSCSQNPVNLISQCIVNKEEGVMREGKFKKKLHHLASGDAAWLNPSLHVGDKAIADEIMSWIE